MVEPEEPLVTSKDERREVFNEPLLMEPKEEPIDDFILASDDLGKEVLNNSTMFLKKPKEEPLDNSFENELSFKGDDDYKKEENLDYDYMLSKVGAVNKSEEAEFSSLFHVEPKLEVFEDSVVIAVENPNGLKVFDDLKDEEMLVGNNMMKGDYVDTMDDLFDDGEDLGGTSDKKLRTDSTGMNEYATPQCIFCEKYPTTAQAYTYHLYNKHKSSLGANGLYVLCSCGFKMSSKNGGPNHNKKCNGCQFTLHERDKVHGRNQGTVKCIHCEKYPSGMRAYAAHLYDQHNSTLSKNGIFLRCSCLAELYCNTIPIHNIKCDNLEFTVHKRESIKKSVDTPQCVLCEKYPLTMRAYTTHLSTHHKSTLHKNGICLHCSCGSKVYTSAYDPWHSKKCSGIKFTLHKSGKNIVHHPQCTLCEKHPSTVYEYIHHLYHHHKSNLKSNQVYLRCSCGVEVHSDSQNLTHSEECAGIEYSLLRVDKSIWTTPQCIVCEKYPPTAYSYAQHLTNQHETSLHANRIYLRCSCGHQIRSSHRSMLHIVECDGRQFTIERDLPMNNDHCYSLPTRYFLY